ncbi:MAG: prolyl oligopeptidase family serine peptidase [Bacteroidota bacterium]
MTKFIQAQENPGYQMPPKAISDLIDAPPTPAASLSPSNKWMLLLDRPNLPAIEEVAQEELRLAGIRINPRKNGSSRAFYYNGMKLRQLDGGEAKPISGMPKKLKIENVRWSPDGSKIGFTITKHNGLELWVTDAETLSAKRLSEAVVNDAISGLPFRWISDSKTIIYKSVLADRGSSPEQPSIPSGPTIQQNIGKSAPVRTYQDLLKNPFDESLFEYYTYSQLVVVNVETGQSKPFGPAGIVKDFSPSPNGQYVMVNTIHRPFSYIVPQSRFPYRVEVYDREGQLVSKIADIPIAENIPKGFGAVRTGPRNFSWRADAPASLYWVEAQDEGDPKKEAAIRDQLYSLAAPFDGQAEKGISFRLRFGGIIWGNGKLAMANEWWWTNRQQITSHWQPDHPEKGKTTLFDRSWEDRYNDPGSFETHVNEYGRFVLMTDKSGQKLYMAGQGASPEGNRPFVDQYDLTTKQSTRLWRSKAPYYEYPLSIIDKDKGLILTRRESREDPPNYFLRQLKTDKLEQVTQFKNPYESLKDIKKELIRYKRDDGVELTGTLYLPPGYDKERDGRLPVFMWAYPREFKSADAAGQVTDSPYEFPRIGWWSPLLWVTQGFAVLDDFSMPIIGEGEEEPNETFIEQLRSGAEAAVRKLDEMGIADTKRLGVGGHSYGAFMTANLMAHTDIFAAGIARSGAYNRTLTPFGFQSEERTFWEASETYFKMSPFMHADKIKEPLLLIHGEADNNSGTYPMQSERFYAAMKGHGATVRLVMLPHESHGYRARESVMHMLWEMTNWLDKYVKKKELQP